MHLGLVMSLVLDFTAYLSSELEVVMAKSQSFFSLRGRACEMTSCVLKTADGLILVHAAPSCACLF